MHPIREVRSVLALAWPVALGELAWVAMSLVDTLMLGRLGPEALGAMALGRTFYIAVGVFGIGLLLGLDTRISQAFGAGDRLGCELWRVQGLYLALGIFPVLFAAYRVILWVLPHFGVTAGVLELTLPYMRAVAWALLPMMLYTVFRRYLTSVNRVRAVMWGLISANVVNAFANWVLIFGRLGAPALGPAGAAWATVAAMGYLAGFLGLASWLLRRDELPRDRRVDPRVRWDWIADLIRLGVPAGVQLALEVGVFSVATTLVGRLNAASLAAHQIALALASLTYMVPLGISSAAAVRVGQHLGAKRPGQAAAAGWAAIALAGAFMSLAALAFVVFPEALVRLFTADPGVVRVGVSLLYVAAVFQIFDGASVVAIGALRGSGDTRRPMLWTLLGYWGMALPLAAYLGAPHRQGVLGVWVALCLGLMAVAVAVTWTWARAAGAVSASPTAPAGPFSRR